MRQYYVSAYRLLRQARKHLPLTPANNPIWGRRIIHFERLDRQHWLAMQAAAKSIGVLIEAGRIRYATER